MLKRGFSLLLSVLMVLSALPVQVFAAEESQSVPAAETTPAETGLESDVSLLDASQDNYGNYTFTTFADLQELAAESYANPTRIRFTGEGGLSVSGDLTVPKNMQLICTDVVIEEGAVLSTAAGSSLTANSLEINGTLSTRDYVKVENELTVNGTFEYYTDAYLGAEALLHRNGTLRSMNTGADLIREHNICSLEELAAAAEIAAGDHVVLSVINLDAYGAGDLVLTETLALPANAEVTVFGDGTLTIGESAALEISCSRAALNIPTIVRGTLTVNTSASMEEATLTFEGDGALEGTGVLNVYLAENAALETVVTGLDMTTVQATEYQSAGRHYWELKPVGDLTPLAAPTDLTWNKVWNPESQQLEDKTGAVSWKSAEPWLGTAVVRLYREGESAYVYSHRYESADLTAGRWHSLDLFALAEPEAGTYSFTVQALSTLEGYGNSEAAASETFVYTPAASALEACTGLDWDWPNALWTAPAGAQVCEVEFLYAPSSGAEPEVIGSDVASGGLLRIPNEAVKLSGTGYYYFRVRGLSPDLNQVANGPWSDLSGAYVLEVLTQSVEEELDYIAENVTDPAEIRKAVQAMDTDTLMEAVTADGSTVMDTLAALEEAAGGSAAVRVEEAVTAIDAGGVSVIGANLHTPLDADTPITLAIDASQREFQLDTDLDSDAAIALSLTLENVEAGDQLEVPVQITLPVPETINPEQLVVLHYLYDGSVEQPEFDLIRQEEQWYVSFTVTSLGDFVLTHIAETQTHRGTSGNLTWQLSSWGNLTISGTGAMEDFQSAKGTPWAVHSADIRSVTLEEGVTYVGDYAFCGLEKLETVTLAASVEAIGAVAFSGSGITAFHVAEGSSAFAVLDGILYSADLTTLVVYPGGRTDAVYVLPETVTAIAPYAVNCNTYLAELILPQGLQSIGEWAFGDCTVMTTITIPGAVVSIGAYAFEESALAQVWFKGEAPAIHETAFDAVIAEVWYPALKDSWTEEVMLPYGGDLTWKAVLIPEEAVLTLAEEYILLKTGETALMDAAIQPAELSDLLQWHAENEAVASVDETGLVTAEGPGTTYIIVTVRDGETELTARCRVDVADPIVVDAVHLGATKVTSELFSTDYAQFDLVLELPQNVSLMSIGEEALPESNSAAIEDVYFAASTVKVAFDLVALDDRRIAVVPTEYAVNYPEELAKTYKSAVTVVVQGEAYTTEEELTITLKQTKPKLKAATLTFNAFYTGQTLMPVITGGTVTRIHPDSRDPASWLSWTEDGSLRLNENAPRKSATGKAYLLVETEEWRIPAAVTMTVKNTYKAPGLKLSATTATFAKEAADSQGVTLKLLPKSKKDSLASLGVTGITAPEGFAVSHFSVEEGTFTLTPTADVTSGKKTLYVTIADTDALVPLTLTVKTKTVSLKLSAKTVTLNTAACDSARVKVTATPGDFLLTGENVTVNGNGAGQLDAFFEDGCLIVRTNDTTPAGATYKLSVSAGGGTAALTVKTISKAPAVTLKTKGSIDLSFPGQSAAVTATFRNYLSGEVESFTASVTAPDGSVSDAFTVEREENVFTVSGKNTDIPTGTYVLNLSLKLPAVEEPVNGTVEFTVKRTAVKLKLTPAKVTLNRTIADEAKVAVTCTTRGYAFDQPIWELKAKNGRDSAEGALDITWNDGRLTIAVNENTKPGATYKLLVKANGYAPAATLTVTIPTLAKSKINPGLKAKGSIDVIRAGTAVTITPSYKNAASAGEEQLYVYSSADGYAEAVNHLFHIERDDQGRYILTAAEGLDHSKTYKAQLVTKFEGIEPVKSALTKFTVKMGTAKVTLAADSNILYSRDRNSRATFTLTAKDAALNGISQVSIKTDKNKLDEKLEIISYGNGEFAVGFKDGVVHSSLIGKTVTLTLNIQFIGNETAKVNTTAKLKLTIRK